MAPTEDRARYWAQIVRQWQSSGLTQAEFCRQSGVVAATFSNWLHKKRFRQRIEPWLHSAEAPTPPDDGSRFVPVHLSEAPADSPAPASATGEATAIEVVLGPGRRLLVRPGFDAETLQRLLPVLESRS